MRLAATFAIPAVGLAAFGWLAIPAEAGRSCSSAHNQCKNYCKTDFGHSPGCFNTCQQRFNSCLRTGSFIWTTKPVEKGLEKR